MDRHNAAIMPSREPILSRIWDALTEAARERAARDGCEGVFEDPNGKRVVVCVPIAVYGHRTDGEPFYRETFTVWVDGKGGLLTAAVSVRHGQRLLLTNQLTQEEQECRVVSVVNKDAGRAEVGIEFVHPAPNFWT